jgi:hypothetical protein
MAATCAAGFGGLLFKYPNLDDRKKNFFCLTALFYRLDE